MDDEPWDGIGMGWDGVGWHWIALQGTTRAYSLLDSMAQHSQGVQPLVPTPGQHSTRKHSRSRQPLGHSQRTTGIAQPGRAAPHPHPAPGTAQHGSARPDSAPELPLPSCMQRPGARAGPGRAAAAAQGPHGGGGRVWCPGSAPFIAEGAEISCQGTAMR